MSAPGEHTSLTLRAPAKLNLFLHVVGRRDDGYHLLETVFHFLDLADEITLERTSTPGIERSRGAPGVAEDEDLVVRAARALAEAMTQLDRAEELADREKDFTGAAALLETVVEGPLRKAGVGESQLALIRLRLASIRLAASNHQGFPPRRWSPRSARPASPGGRPRPWTRWSTTTTDTPRDCSTGCFSRRPSRP